MTDEEEEGVELRELISKLPKEMPRVQMFHSVDFQRNADDAIPVQRGAASDSAA